MDELNYPGGAGDGSVVDERLQKLLLQMQGLEEGSNLPLQGENLKAELEGILHNLEDVKEQMKGIGEIPPRTQQLLLQIRSLIQHYNIRTVQKSYQSLVWATHSLQTLPL